MCISIFSAHYVMVQWFTEKNKSIVYASLDWTGDCPLWRCKDQVDIFSKKKKRSSGHLESAANTATNMTWSITTSMHMKWSRWDRAKDL